MIQDRLTAKFQSAKPSKHRNATSPKAAPAKAKTEKPAADTYTKGRAIAASFWL